MEILEGFLAHGTHSAAGVASDSATRRCRPNACRHPVHPVRKAIGSDFEGTLCNLAGMGIARSRCALRDTGTAPLAG
jgi:hypothetical protein